MNTTALCGYCGRPGYALTWLNGRGYHKECLHGPGWQQQHYAPNPPGPKPWGITVPILTEADVRRIIREELASTKGERD